MLNKFKKSLEFIGLNTDNMNHSECPKNVYKFEDETIDKYWRCFYAFYRNGRTDVLSELAAHCMKELGDIK